MTRTLALALLSVVLVASMAFGGVPQLVNYQGKLTDAVGKPVTATKSMEFAFYDAASGGTQLGGFTETQKVSVTTGIFNVLIGSATAGGVPASVFSGTNVYLSVKVAGEELEPRQRIASVAYAYRAASADSAAGSTNADLLDSLDSTQFLRSDASDTTSGTLTVERGVDATGTNGHQMILPGGGFEIVPGNPGLKATGTAGGLLTPGAPAVEAIGGGGTLIGSIDTAIRSIGNVYFLNHDDPWHGIYFNPGNGTSDYACDMGLYGSTGTSYAGIRFQFDTEYTADNGPRFRTGDGSVFSIYGSSVSDPRQLRFSGPSYGELILDWANGVIQLGGSTADTVKVPADIEGGLRVYHDIGGGANSCAIRAENTNAGGIAYTGVVTSTDACAVFINKGTGDIIRGFSGATGGNMVTELSSSGFLRSAAFYTGPDGTAPPQVFAGGFNFTTDAGDITASGDLMANDNLIVGSNAYIQGDMYVSGAKHAVVNTQDFGMRKVYADESAEVFFFDRGSARLADGSATIELDPIFLETVTIDDGHPMIVFASPTGECRGVYVAETTGKSFVVKELGNGKSGATFTWEVGAKRKGYENVRLAKPEIPASH